MSNLLRMLNFLVWSDVVQKLSPGSQIAMSSPSTPELYQEYYQRFIDENPHVTVYSYQSKSNGYELLTTYPRDNQREKKDLLICPISVPKHRIFYNRPPGYSSLEFFDPLIYREIRLRKKYSHRISDRQKSRGGKGTEKAKKNIKHSLPSPASDSTYSTEVEDFALPAPTMTSISLDSTAFPTPSPTDYLCGTQACSCFEASRYTCCSEYCSDPSCIATPTISSNLAILPTPSVRVHPYATIADSCYFEASGYYPSFFQPSSTSMAPVFYPQSISRSSQINYVPNVMPVTAIDYSQSSTSL